MLIITKYNHALITHRIATPPWTHKIIQIQQMDIPEAASHSL